MGDREKERKKEKKREREWETERVREKQRDRHRTTFYVFYTLNASVRPSVCLSKTKIWSTFRSVLLEFKEVRGADVQQKN